MSEDESTDDCTRLHLLLTERFRGHPYTWDYLTKCLFLMLDMTSFRLVIQGETAVHQGDIIESCGINLARTIRTEDYNFVRAMHISARRVLEIGFIAEGHRNERSYRYEHPAMARCIRRFMDRRNNIRKSDYLLFTLNNVLPIEEE